MKSKHNYEQAIQSPDFLDLKKQAEDEMKRFAAFEKNQHRLLTDAYEVTRTDMIRQHAGRKVEARKDVSRPSSLRIPCGISAQHFAC